MSRFISTDYQYQKSVSKNEQKNYVSLSKNSEPYRRIQYSLKLCLRMLNGRFDELEIQQAHSASINFDQRFKDKITLEVFYRAKDYEEENYLLKNGQFPPEEKDKPRMFTSGTIVESAEELLENIHYNFFLFKIVVGKSFCYQKQQNERIEDLKLRENYDSLYLEGYSPSNLFQHKYVIFNKDSILLTYIVKTKIKIEPLAGYQEAMTCTCGNQAVKYCENDAAFYCEDCDVIAHESIQKDNLSKLMSSHVRVPVEEKMRKKDFEKCPEHGKPV